MPIRREGDFLIWSDGDLPGVFLGLESSNLDRCLDEYRRGAYCGVFGSREFGFLERDLACLSDIGPLLGVHFWDVQLENVDALYLHPTLAYLSIPCKRPAMNFALFDALKYVYMHWVPRDAGMNSQRLVRSFALWHCNPRSKSLMGFEWPSACLGEASLVWSNVVSLRGLVGLCGVKRFEVHRARNLVSLEGIEALAHSVETVIVANCPKLTDVSALDRLEHLSAAVIDGARVRG